MPIYAHADRPGPLHQGRRHDGRGRVDETGACVLYFTRAEIEDGALAGKGWSSAWAADPIDLFFLQIQGSGRLKLPDGSVMRIGYADQNGREYVADRPAACASAASCPPGGANMKAIVAWMRAQPDGGGADARESELHLLQGADRPGPARGARACR